MTTVIGIDIGGTKIAGLVTDETYQPILERVITTPDAVKPTALINMDRPQAEAAGRAALLHDVIALCRDLQREAEQQHHHIDAIGVGSAGQIDPQTGQVLDANDNLLGWRGTALGPTLVQTFGVPVAVENDVRAMAVAECHLGAGQPYEHVLCLTIGTGIGGALVLQKRLWHGAHFGAGEFGYLSASPTQTIEQVAAGPALERQYQAATQSPEMMSLQGIAQRALQGDEIARSIIQTGAEALGRVLAPVMAFIDPQAVVIGGGLAQMDTLWWQPFVESIQRFAVLSVQTTPVLKATLGHRAGMIGAAILAVQKKDGA
jgi:glucokinase